MKRYTAKYAAGTIFEVFDLMTSRVVCLKVTHVTFSDCDLPMYCFLQVWGNGDFMKAGMEVDDMDQDDVSQMARFANII